MTARILVVDDIQANVRLLEARLMAEYFQVLTAGNGRDALKLCDNGQVDLVQRLLDTEEIIRAFDTNLVLLKAADMALDKPQRVIDLWDETAHSARLLFAARRLLLELTGMLAALDAGVQGLELRLLHRRLPASRVRVGLLQPSRDVEHLLAFADVFCRQRSARQVHAAGVDAHELQERQLALLVKRHFAAVAVVQENVYPVRIEVANVQIGYLWHVPEHLSD